MIYEKVWRFWFWHINRVAIPNTVEVVRKPFTSWICLFMKLKQMNPLRKRKYYSWNDTRIVLLIWLSVVSILDAEGETLKLLLILIWGVTEKTNTGWFNFEEFYDDSKRRHTFTSCKFDFWMGFQHSKTTNYAECSIRYCEKLTQALDGT